VAEKLSSEKSKCNAAVNIASYSINVAVFNMKAMPDDNILTCVTVWPVMASMQLTVYCQRLVTLVTIQ